MILHLLMLTASVACPSLDAGSGWRCSVVSVGDVDGDGAGDFALAERSWGPFGFLGTKAEGEPPPERPWPADEVTPRNVWLLSGATGEPLLSIGSEALDPGFGRALAYLGDLNGDGTGELAVTSEGRVRIHSCKDGTVLHEIRSPEGIARSVPTTVVGGKDVDGDRIPDFMILWLGWGDGTTGLAHLHSGEDASVLGLLGCLDPRRVAASYPGVPYHRIGAGELGPAANLFSDRSGDGQAEVVLTTRGPSAPDGDAGWRIHVLAQSGSQPLETWHLPVKPMNLAPWILQDPGDLPDRDGDGIAEYLIAANEDSGDCDPGFLEVRSGAGGEVLGRLPFSRFGNGFNGDCGAGVDACGIDDVNGDGVDDLVAHMPRLREVRVLSGKDLSLLNRRRTVEWTSLKEPEPPTGR